MGATYTKLLFHIVFATKNREPSLEDEIRGPLFQYMGGIVRARKGVAEEIGGVADHVHLLVNWRAGESLASLMQKVKGGTSHWLGETFPAKKGFRWQKGYSAFSVSESKREDVARYIRRQKEHHERKSYLAELEWLLALHNIEHDPREL